MSKVRTRFTPDLIAREALDSLQRFNRAQQKGLKPDAQARAVALGTRSQLEERLRRALGGLPVGFNDVKREIQKAAAALLPEGEA